MRPLSHQGYKVLGKGKKSVSSNSTYNIRLIIR